MLAEATQIGTDQSGVIAALKNASSATGVDFSYLLSTATRESSLKTNAQSATSSASGLFQFVDQTWLGLIKNYGAKFGLSSMADAIERTPEGHYRADNSSDRQAILALRKDPQVSALMEGEYANETRCQMKSSLGRDVCQGELYAAHFLGPQAACRLIEANNAQPSESAASIFPQAAEANRSVFFHTDGSAKSVSEVYQWATRGGQSGLSSQMASIGRGSRHHAKATSVPLSLDGGDENSNAMMSLASWTPQHGFFSSDAGDSSSPSSTLLLTPSVMDIFAQAKAMATKAH
jgi:hypothetical protein